MVIPHYDRVDLLTACVERLSDALAGEAVELVVADDASPPPAQEALAALAARTGIRLVVSTRRRGLGANTNQGLAAARGRFVLQVQDDHILDQPDGEFLRAGIAALDAWPDLAIIRYEVGGPLGEAERRELGQWTVAVADSRLAQNGSGRFDLYSDWPHLKRRSLHEHLGPYVEDRSMGATELEFSFRLRRAGGEVATVVGFEWSFENAGGPDRSYQVGTDKASWRRRFRPAKALAAYGAYRVTGRFPYRFYP